MARVACPGELLDHQEPQALKLTMPRKKDNLAVQLAQFEVTCKADGVDKGDELP